MASFADIYEEMANILELDPATLDEEQQANREAYLAELQDMSAAKIDGFAAWVRLQTQRAKSVREEARMLDRRAANIEKNLAGLREYYLKTMREHGHDRLRGNAYSISVRRTESVDVFDLDVLGQDNPELVRVKTEPRKEEIGRLLRQGQQVAGCRLSENLSLAIR